VDDAVGGTAGVTVGVTAGVADGATVGGKEVEELDDVPGPFDELAAGGGLQLETRASASSTAVTAPARDHEAITPR
jgi:hypothetical protein